MKFNLVFLVASAVSMILAPSVAAAPRLKPRTTPLLEFEKEVQRFPSRDLCWEYIDLANAHLIYIGNRMSLEPHFADDWEEYRQQVEGWKEVWCNMANARDTFFSLGYRQECLDKVREAIGEHAYNIGFIWPPVAAHMMIICDEPPQDAIVAENAASHPDREFAHGIDTRTGSRQIRPNGAGIVCRIDGISAVRVQSVAVEHRPDVANA